MGSRKRVIIWGPGEVGGATLRAAHADDAIEVVGVKVFSPHKNGRDAGELVGIGPIDIRATTSKRDILDLDADCVIVTPLPSSILEGIDADVIDLLESGKNVVTTAAYHNLAMPNWHNRATTPMSRLREMSRSNGLWRDAAERRTMRVGRALTASKRFDSIGNIAFKGVAEQRFPARATPERILDACRKGGATLHGTGVHPTFMVERLLKRMCQPLSEVSHIRFVESVDFSHAPDGMWGGLKFFGFGRDIADIDTDWFLAKAGDFYYGDLTGNVAHALYGAHPGEVRVERSMRALPAKSDIRIGSTHIARGTAAVMHMTHRGDLGDHHFFTNEECWYLTPENAFRGDDLPYGNFPPHGGYTFEVTGKPTSFRGQFASPELRPHGNMITAASANALLDAVVPTCDAAPGVLIDDAEPFFRPATAGIR